MFKGLLQQIGLIQEEKKIDVEKIKDSLSIKINKTSKRSKGKKLKEQTDSLFLNKKETLDKVIKNIPFDALLKRIVTLQNIINDFGIPRRTFNHYLQKGLIKSHSVFGGAEIFDLNDVDKLPHIGNSFTFSEAAKYYKISRNKFITAINNRKLKIAEYQMQKNRRLFQKDIENWIRKYGIDKDDLHVEKKEE